MLTSYFGRYQAYYMLPSQYHTMGRTFGPDLIIPTVQRQHFYNPQEQSVFYPDPNHLHHNQQEQQQQQQSQKEELGKANTLERKQTKEKSEREHFRQGQNNSEIKFSIERILSSEGTGNCRENLKEKIKEKNEEDDDDDEEEAECNTEDIKSEMDTEESVHYEWLHCTRYKPPKLQRTRKKENSKKRKLGRNPRVPFTQHQVVGLERKFSRTHYLSSMDVAELSSALNLTETRVKIWFQNRRARERRNNHTKQTQGQGSEQGDGSDSKFMFAPSTSCFGPSMVVSNPDSSQRSLQQLQEAIQHCSAFAPMPYRHNSSGT
ncbi:homeobox protein MSH-B-like [Mercenaria mercenaria]|uniref:homeobox protein MSH-B-like n=1 Tax=Mercenaria mercenaria TaxID=6596 RepID=UPI00234F143D|nr:homeobox protein MSH-B-like [Mercenaria mercenaria]